MSMSLETALSSGLDQPGLTESKRYERVMAQIDKVIKKLDKNNNPDDGFAAARELLDVQRLSGLAMGRLLYEMKDRWEHRWAELGIAQQRFEDQAHRELGLAPVTVRRYVTAWEKLQSPNIPTEVKPLLLGRKMEDQVAITSTAKHMPQGDFTPGEWERIAKTADTHTLRDTLAELKGTERKNNTLVIWLRKDGTLQAKEGKGAYVTIGMLAINPVEGAALSESKQKVATRALERIIASAGIVRE